MASSALIEDLLKQFAENPRRVFARLANEYRKAGEFEQAIEICRAHIPQHQGYISGHIVLGQALFDSGRFDEARATFEVALGLDPENMIALRQLGDVARVTGDTAAARGWYQRLLDVDPQNEEIIALLAELSAVADVQAATPTAPTESASVPSEPGPAPGGPSATPAGDTPPPSRPLALEEVLGGAPTTAVAGATPSSDAVAEHEPIDLAIESFDLLPASEGAAPGMEGIERSTEWLPGGIDFGSLTDQAARDSADAGGEGPSPRGEGAPREVAGHPTGPDASSIPRSSSKIPSPPAEMAEGAPAAELPAGKAAGSRDRSSPSAPAPYTAGTRPDDATWDSMMGRTLDAEELGEVAAAPQAFVTETMAELYLQQGYTEEALDLYRQLAAQNPNDQALRDRVAQLEQGARSSVGVASVSDAVFDAAQKRHSARPRKTIRSFFGRLAGRRVAPTEGTPGADQPDARQPSEPTDQQQHVRSRMNAGNATRFDEPRANDPSAASGSGDEMDELDQLNQLFDAVPPTPSEIPAHSEPPAPTAELDLLYDPSAETEGASRETAAAPAPSGDVENELFPGASVSADDEHAASMLASAFGQGEGASDVGGEPTRAAAKELSLDDVFRDTDAPSASRAAAPLAYREFFSGSDSMVANDRGGHPAQEESEAEEGPPSADLETFNAWLEGLKK